MSLLDELKAIGRPALPEEKVFVQDWSREVTLRGFTIGDGVALRKGAHRGPDGEIVADEAFTLRAIAWAIVDGDDRPLANPEGEAVVGNLSQESFLQLAAGLNRISTILPADAEKNSPEAAGAGSSSGSPPASVAPSPSSSAISPNASSENGPSSPSESRTSAAA